MGDRMNALLSPSQHTILARMSDGEWRRGSDLTCMAKSLAHLSRRGFIRRDFDETGYLFSLWTITPDGMAAMDENNAITSTEL